MGGILVLALLLAVACKKEETTNNYRTGERAGRAKIAAKPATFDTSVASTTYTSYYSTSLYSDDVWVGFDYYSYDYKGVVTWAEMVYLNFTSSGEDLTYSEVSYALDYYGLLNVLNGDKGQPYSFDYTGATADLVVKEDSGKEISYPPLNLVGLDVARKVYVNPWGSVAGKDNFIRWLEILTNNTGAPVTVDVVLGGYEYYSQDVKASSDGDGVAEAGKDKWFITDEESTVWTYSTYIVGHLVDGTEGYSEADNFIVATTTSGVLDFWTSGWSTTAYDVSTMTMTIDDNSMMFTWNDVTVNPGETKILMHLANLTPPRIISWSNGMPDAIESAEKLDSAPPEVVASMDADEINAVTNWPAARNNCNITGPEKAMKPGVLVSAENETSTVTAQSYSLPDGSFGICLDAADGDWIKLTVDGKLVKRVKVKDE
jgi:hypothetical protein